MVLHGTCITLADTCRLIFFPTYFLQYLQVLQEKLLISIQLFQLTLIILTLSDFRTYYILTMMVFLREEEKLACLFMLLKRTKYINFLLKIIYNFIRTLYRQEHYMNFILNLHIQQTLQVREK